MNEAVLYPQVFARAPIGLAILDRQGRIVVANPAVAEFFGCEPRELADLRLVTAFTFPAEAAREADLFLELVGGKRTHYQLEKRYLRPDGQVVWARLHVVLLTDDQGRNGNLVLTTIEDVTAHHLATARRQREAKLDALARLAAEVLQRLNHLMVATLGSSQLLLAEGNADHPYRELAETVRDTVERTLTVNRQLVEFCSRQVLALTFVDLNALLLRMQPRLRSLLGIDVELVTALKPSLGHVKADAAQLEKVLLLLAANAKEAMATGGRLTITTGTALIVDEQPGRRPEKPLSYVTLSVSDTGQGMDAKTLERLFEPFFSTKERNRGAGLSLATAHGIIRQIGGFMDVVSEVGKGSTFTIHLPRTTDTVPEFTVPASLTDTSRERQTVMIVDDDDATRGRLRSLLKAEGYATLEARYVGEALLQCLRHHGPIQLIVSEVAPQRLTPREFMEQVAALRPTTQFLFLVDAPAEGELVAGLASVVRSAPPETILQSVRAALACAVERT